MQSYTRPGESPIDATANVTTALFAAAVDHPNRPALSRRVGDRFVDMTTRELADEVTAVAAGFIAMGIEPGSRICLLSATRYEWTILDYAIWAAGCVTVPIYETSSPEQIAWIVEDSGAVAILIESEELRANFDQVADRLPSCQHVVVIEDDGLAQLRSRGEDVTAADVRARAASVTADEVATLVYTSGTTGRPKGCILTHGNFLWDAQQVIAISQEFFRPGMSTLLFLPLAHIFARVIQIGCIQAGVKLGFSTGIPHLMEELGMYKPDFLLAVPRVFEKVYNGAKQKAHDASPIKGKIFDAAAATAIAWSQATTSRGRPSLQLELRHRLFDLLVYSKLRAAIGGRTRHAVSGGAALGARLGHFFHGAGILILEGYGLTETTAGSFLNQPSAFRIGSVGQPLPGLSVQIAEDGEILLKGGGLFRGYHDNDAATKEAIDEDGWFHTGDLGRLDDDGFLYITGRKKEILVTAGGKNVAPAVLEDLLRSHPLISQSMVVGDGEPFIAALVTIDPEALGPWLARHGRPEASTAELVDDPALRAEVQSAVDEANRAVSKAESIRTFRILPRDFEVGVELSQKMSVKRHVVTEQYGDVIADIYAGVQRV